MSTTSEEAELMAEVIGVITELAHRKKSQIHLSELRWKIYQEYADSEDQESDIIGTYNHLCE